MANAPVIALIGGGTGSFTLLQGLKGFTPNISAIVSMSDDGGSSGELRDEFGVLPPGDIRQCLVALSNMPEVRDIFAYRYDKNSSLRGHSLGNLILSALEMRHGDFQQAVEIASSMLDITGRVVPVTLDNHKLVMQDGEERVEGEYHIGHRRINSADATVSHEPTATLNPDAADAITNADLVVIAPGNLYGSLLPALAVDGMAEAFKKSSAKKVVVSNLVTKPGQTDGWHFTDYVKTIEQYVGKDQIDFVLFNLDPPSAELLERYAAEGEYPVATDLKKFADISAKPIGANLLAKKPAKQDANDTIIPRTLIRHDAHQVGRELMRIFYL